MVEAEKMSSFLACIQLGKPAKDCPAVKTAEDRKAYTTLEAEAKKIFASGGNLEIPKAWV